MVSNYDSCVIECNCSLVPAVTQTPVQHHCWGMDLRIAVFQATGFSAHFLRKLRRHQSKLHVDYFVELNYISTLEPMLSDEFIRFFMCLRLCVFM